MMKCYRIRKKVEFLDSYDYEWMETRGVADYFVGPLYDTHKGAKSAMSNRSGYFYSHKKHEYEIVEYDMVEKGVV